MNYYKNNMIIEYNYYIVAKILLKKIKQFVILFNKVILINNLVKI